MVKKQKNEKKGVPVVDSTCCRICQTISREALVSPCYCKGSVGHVHKNCLQEWLSNTNKTTCELCYFQFKMIQERRYKCCESLCVWLFLPTVCDHLRADFIFVVLLTIITSLIATFCYFLLVSEKNRNDFQPKLTVGIVMGIVLVWYLREMINLVTYNVNEWRLWWHSCVVTKIVLEDQKTPVKKGLVKIDEEVQSVTLENTTELSVHHSEHEISFNQNKLQNQPSSSSSTSNDI